MTGRDKHDHEHRHSHAPSADADRPMIAAALAIIATFMIVEVIAGLLSGSLALLTDAAHMLTDVAALALALWAARLAARRAVGSYTYGFKRAEILSAQVNGVSLLLLGALLGYEAIGRLASPPTVAGGVVIVVGSVGALANIGAAAMLARAERRSLNVEGAKQHVLIDLVGSLAAIVAGVIIVTTGWKLADPITALVVVVLMLRSGMRLVNDATRVLLEAAPHGLDPEPIGRAMSRHQGVVEVHDLHVWEVTSGFPLMSAHVLVAADEDCHKRRRELDDMITAEFGISHTTLQVEHAPVARPLQIAPADHSREQR